MDKFSKTIYKQVIGGLPKFIKQQYQNQGDAYDTITVSPDKKKEVSLKNNNDLKYLLYYNNFYLCKKMNGTQIIMICDKDVAKAFGTSSKMSLYVKQDNVSFRGNYQVIETFTFLSVLQPQVNYDKVKLFYRIS